MNPIIAGRANDFGLLARGRCYVTPCGRSNSASSLAGAFSRHGSVSMPVSPQCDQDDGSFLLSFESQCQLCKSPVTSSAIRALLQLARVLLRLARVLLRLLLLLLRLSRALLRLARVLLQLARVLLRLSRVLFDWLVFFFGCFVFFFGVC